MISPALGVFGVLCAILGISLAIFIVAIIFSYVNGKAEYGAHEEIKIQHDYRGDE